MLHERGREQGRRRRWEEEGEIERERREESREWEGGEGGGRICVAPTEMVLHYVG